MKTLSHSVESTRFASPKKKKKTLNEYEQRLISIKKKLEFDSDHSQSTPTKRKSPLECHTIKFTAYGGTARREDLDEAKIFNTEDELEEDLEKEMKLIASFKNKKNDRRLQQLQDAMNRMTKSQMRKSHDERSLPKYSSPMKRTKSPFNPDDGREFLDGLLAIGPDDILRSKSRSQSPTKSTRSRRPHSPEIHTVPSHVSSANRSVKKSKRSNSKPVMKDKSTQDPDVLGLVSPSKQTQTDTSGMQTNPTTQSVQYTSESHPPSSGLSVSHNFNGLTQDMESFAKSLEELDDAIYVHSLTRKRSQRKRTLTSDRVASYIPATVPQVEKIQFSCSAKNFKPVAVITEDDDSTNSPKSLARSRRESLDFISIESDAQENVNNSGKFLYRNRYTAEEMEPQLIKTTRSERKTERNPDDGIHKKLFDTESLDSARKENTLESHAKKITNTVDINGADILMTCLDKQSNKRESSKQESRQHSLLENLTPRSEETLFNISTDFANRKLKQSNLYLEDSLETSSPQSTVLRYSQQKLHSRDSHHVPNDAKGSFIHRKLAGGALDDERDSGPMSLKDLDSSSDEASTVCENGRNSLDKTKKSKKESDFLREVKDLKESLHIFNHCKFDTSNSIFDPASCTDVSLELSRIENCSSIGPWDVSSNKTPRDVEKVVTSRGNSGHTLSSPSKKSKAENSGNVPYVVSHSTQQLKNNDLKMSKPPTDRKTVSYSESQKPMLKIPLRKNKVDIGHIQKLHEDVFTRLSQSENIEHLVGLDQRGMDAKRPLYRKEEFPTKKSCFDLAISDTVLQPSQRSSFAEQTARVFQRSRKVDKRTLKPTVVNSLNIQQSKMANKHSGELQISNNPAMCLPVKRGEHGYYFPLTKVASDGSRAPKKSSRRVPNVIAAQSKGGKPKCVFNGMGFIDREKKLDEISDILSQSLSRKQNNVKSDLTKENVVNALDIKFDIDCQRKRGVSSEEPTPKRSNGKQRQRRLSNVDSDIQKMDIEGRNCVINYDLAFQKQLNDFGKRLEAIENDGQRSKMIVECGEDVHFKHQGCTKNKNRGLGIREERRNSESLGLKIDSQAPRNTDMESRLHADDSSLLKQINNFRNSQNVQKQDLNNRNFNSSLLHQNKMNDYIGLEENMHVENDEIKDMQWLQKELKQKYQEKDGIKQSQNGLVSEIESTEGEQDVSKKLTMSDLYTPVTQLITDESDEGSLGSSSGKENHPLPLKAVFKNLKKSRALENEQSKDIEREVMEVNNRKEMKSAHCIQSVPEFKKNAQMLRSTQISDSTISKTQPNSVDVILSHLDNPDSVKLLQKLYSVDGQPREDLMMKAEYFRRWQQRTRDKQYDRFMYGDSKLKANEFLFKHLVGKHFKKWNDKANELWAERKADELYQRHMLRKGLGGFKWAINRSQHYYDIMKSRTQNIMLGMLFTKWKSRTIEQQRERLELHFKTWHQYTEEQKRARVFCENMNHKLMRKSLTHWIGRYRMKLKENKADGFARNSMLYNSLIIWKLFTNTSRTKRQRVQQAVILYDKNLERKYFEKILTLYQAVQKAKMFHSKNLMRHAIRDWKEGTNTSIEEARQDMCTSYEHWKTKTTGRYFYEWREAWLITKAVNLDRRFTTRNFFDKWQKALLARKEREKDILVQLSSKKLSRHFSAWQRVVEQQKGKRAALTCHIEGVLLQLKLRQWRDYTDYKLQLRSQCESFRNKCNERIQREKFIVWLEKYLQCVREEKARKHWSRSCLRKAVAKWKLNCKKTRLNKILIESEPFRNFVLVKAMFKKWKNARTEIQEEKYEADEKQKELERLKLRRKFIFWRSALNQVIRIQPMINARNESLVKECFQSWHDLSKHKKECYKNQDELMKRRRRRIFNIWLRQYDICQLEKEIRKEKCTKTSLRCITEWKNVVERKKLAVSFNKQSLQKWFFQYWKSKTCSQISEKIEAFEEQERSHDLKRQYFTLWMNNIQRDLTLEEDKIVALHQQQSYSRLRQAFCSWKHQLHINLVARMYQRGLRVKYLRKVLLAWADTTNYSMQDAVVQFSIRLGLPVQDSEQTSSADMSDMSFDRQSVQSYVSEMSEGEMTVCESPRSCSSRVTCTSLNRLFAGLPGERSVDLENFDFDNQSLLSGIESAIYDEREAKIQRLQEMVHMFVMRLSNWPVSVVFDQWKEFTLRQRELKEAASELQTFSRTVKLKLALQTWKNQFYGVLRARYHRNMVLKRNVFDCLKDYQKCRRTKQELSSLASYHYKMTVMKTLFPMWAEKTKEKQHKENIIHLWNTATLEEQKLFPMEHQFTTKLNRRSLQICFSIWLVKFQFMRKIQKAYHIGILKRTLNAWQQWSHDSFIRKQKCEEFQRKRLQAQMFKLWQVKLHQKQATEEKYQNAWKNYLAVIFSNWHQWARDNRNYKALECQLTSKLNQNRLQQSFSYWHELSVKCRQVRQKHNLNITKQALRGWLDVMKHKKSEKKTVLQFQVKSYTTLVERLFQTWKERYANRLSEQEQRQKHIQSLALEIGRKWLRKAMKTRGALFFKQLQQQTVASYFSKWKSEYEHVLHLNDMLDNHVAEKNRELESKLLQEWKMRMLLNHVDRVHGAKLQVTVFSEWLMWTRAAKERRRRGMALKKALEERTQHVYLKLWAAKTQLSQSVQQHYNTKLTIRTLQAWHCYTQKKKTLDENYTIMAAKVRRNRLQKAFSIQRSRFDYCQGLNETAQKIHDDKQKASQRHCLLVWHDKLDRIMSARCYGKFLAWRVARQWRNFVCSKKAQRQREAQQEEEAIKHYNKQLCKKAFQCMKLERCVSQQLERHKDRLQAKYGSLWKLKVDLSYTARCVDKERLMKKCWRNWRIEYSQRKSAAKVQSFYTRQLLTQCFTSWRKLKIKPTKLSSIPVPVSMDKNSSELLNNKLISNGAVTSIPLYNTDMNTEGMIVYPGLYDFQLSQKQPTNSKSLSGAFGTNKNTLTRSNIRKFISRPDKHRSRIPSPSFK